MNLKSFFVILLSTNLLALAAEQWTVGTPIVTYYAGPTMSEAVAIMTGATTLAETPGKPA